MGPTRLSLKRSLLVSTFLAVSVFSAVSMAQNAAASSAQSAASTPSTTEKTSTTAKETSTSTSAKETSTSSTKEGTTTITGGTTGTTVITGGTTLPTVSTTLTGLPTLSTTANNGVNTYPAATVPPTSNAPFMNHSTLPDGTVFIAVGAILGAFGAAILAWRGIVACLLHRSVERAAMAQHAANDKAAAFPPPPAPFYKYTDRGESTPSLAVGGQIPGRGVRRSTRGPIPSATPSQTNLFFSPTAPGGAGNVGGHRDSSLRDSRYLPSGFYASSASPIPPYGHGPSISLSNLRPSSRGAGAGQGAGGAMHGTTPPDSPSVGSRGTPVPRNFSTSSINLNRPPSGRAPSAYLDDLLDDQQGQWPPAPPHAQSAQYGHGHSASGRF